MSTVVTKLGDHDLKVGDLVVYDSNSDSTGGVIFQITENFDSPCTDDEKRRPWVTKNMGYKNEKGRDLSPMEIAGYLRLKPVFSFFPTELGVKPKGKGATVLVYHHVLNIVPPLIKKVDVLSLATKYAELGTLVRDVAIQHGMVHQGLEGG